MKNSVFIIFSVFLGLSNCSFAEKVELMGCEWQVPDRFVKRGAGSVNSWVSRSGERAFFHFKDDFFNNDYIEIAVSPTDLRQKVSFSKIDNGYEIVVYIEYLVSNEKFIFPSWIVLKNQKDKGVFYLNGLKEDEVIEFIGSCMPSVNIKNLKH
ncbi:MAG: hypothetical protein V4732_09875 [Pseudomonadota bacterium]